MDVMDLKKVGVVSTPLALNVNVLVAARLVAASTPTTVTVPGANADAPKIATDSCAGLIGWLKAAAPAAACAATTWVGSACAAPWKKNWLAFVETVGVAPKKSPVVTNGFGAAGAGVAATVTEA